MATLNTQLTTTGAISETIQTFYDRKMLKDMKPKLLHYQYGQKRPIPRGNGKTVDFRKWTPFAALTDALSEGVVPDGQNLAMTNVTATVKGYGGYVALSDLLVLTAIDPVASDAVEMMADQGGLSVDTVVRDIIHQGTSAQIAGSNTYRYQLEATDVLSTTEIRKAVRTLKKNNAPQFMRGGKGYYIAIVSPDTTYDLQNDTTWQDVAKYQDKEMIFSGEIGRIFGVIVVETPQAKTLVGDDIIGAAASVTIASWNNGTKTATIDEVLTTAEAAALVDRYLLFHDITDDSEVYSLVTAAAAGTAGTATITFDDNATALGFTPADGDIIYPGEGGAAGIEIGSTLVLGRDAFGVVDIEGGSNVKTIIKAAGSAGTADPLNQISTVGWKVTAFAAKILQEAWMVRIEHGVSA